MSNPYLAKLHNLLESQRALQGQKVENATPGRTDKTDKTGSVSFVSDGWSHVFKFGGGQGDGEGCTNEGSRASENQKTASTSNSQNRQNPSAYARVFAVLCKRCPAHIELVRWRQVMEDGERFLAEWGDQAEALGWSSRDLFGLHEVPANPHPTYQRLSRYDCTGLIWLLQGCPVVAVTEATAAIKMPTGNITTYRRHNKPAYGPLGDSIDDFVA
jgi:hypothetical protein